MLLDHFVVHIDNNRSLLSDLANRAKSAGFPMDLNKGKGTKGFHALNIWMGQQYFEIPWLKREDGGGWKSEWVDMYNSGKRGLFCIFLRAKNIDQLEIQLRKIGIPIKKEKVSFKVLGLFTKTMPWTTLHLPQLPGSDIEISFIEYEPGIVEKWITQMKPNATSVGIQGIGGCEIQVIQFNECVNFLKRVFPNATETEKSLSIPLEHGFLNVKPGTRNNTTFVASASNPALQGKKFGFENVEVRVN